MPMFELDRTIDRLEVKGARHWTALALVAALALVLLSQVFVPDLPIVARGVVLVLALASAWLCLGLARRGPSSIMVTDLGLVDNFDRVICTFDQIEKIDHGAFALKPSKGFLIRLRASANPGWHPGLWWRYGKRVGIGGMTPAAETKLLAEVLTERVASGMPGA